MASVCDRRSIRLDYLPRHIQRACNKASAINADEIFMVNLISDGWLCCTWCSVALMGNDDEMLQSVLYLAFRCVCFLQHTTRIHDCFLPGSF